ncbi:YsnF/AvaK domain-containing protein [Deinococcus sp. YIM 134068]|uniref:YsnF/AvaK domain-containing protein n=1 Tax=Deinococcus lichenicola TaxID=3118910 RepID=UPI002F938C27
MDDQGKDTRQEGEETQTTTESTGRTVTTEQISDFRKVVETLRLHEERAVVEVVPESLGAVTIRRVVTERQEVVPITLSSERLEITVREGVGGRVTMNGEVMEVGRTYEVPIYEERALINKEIFPLSDVTIAKQRETYKQVETLTLRREELDVEDPQGLVRDRTMPGGSEPQR